MKSPRSLLFLAVLVSGLVGYVLGGHQTAPGAGRLDSPPGEPLREEVARLGRQVLDLRGEREALKSQLVMIGRAVRDDPTKAVQAVQDVLSLAEHRTAAARGAGAGRYGCCWSLNSQRSQSCSWTYS